MEGGRLFLFMVVSFAIGCVSDSFENVPFFSVIVFGLVVIDF